MKRIGDDKLVFSWSLYESERSKIVWRHRGLGVGEFNWSLAWLDRGGKGRLGGVDWLVEGVVVGYEIVEGVATLFWNSGWACVIVHG